MTELIVVLVMISLIMLLAQMNFFSLLTKNTFRVQAQELISAMQMAANAAAESDKRYEVIIDMTEQTYVLREITSPDLSEVLDEEIIVSNEFSNNCQAAYVLLTAILPTRAGRSSVSDIRAGNTAAESSCSTEMKRRIRSWSTG